MVEHSPVCATLLFSGVEVGREDAALGVESTGRGSKVAAWSPETVNVCADSEGGGVHDGLPLSVGPTIQQETILRRPVDVVPLVVLLQKTAGAFPAKAVVPPQYRLEDGCRDLSWSEAPVATDVFVYKALLVVCALAEANAAGVVAVGAVLLLAAERVKETCRAGLLGLPLLCRVGGSCEDAGGKYRQEEGMGSHLGNWAG